MLTAANLLYTHLCPLVSATIFSLVLLALCQNFRTENQHLGIAFLKYQELFGETNN